MSNPIEVHGLVKTFGSTQALDGLDLQLAPGEVHGFLGPNGAGKSTTIRVLLGLLRSDAGTCSTPSGPARSSRRWVGGAAVLGSTWLLAVAGVATAVGRGDGLGAVGAPLVQAPAVWLVLALALLLLSVRSRWAVAGWAVLALFVTLGEVGPGLDLPTWVVGLSPFHHVPRYPSEAFAWTPELAMTGLTAVVLAAAWTRYRSRDIG